MLESRLFAVEEMALIEQEFDYLNESLERLGRKDWLNVLLGGMVGLGIKLALEPGRIKDLLGLAGAMAESLLE
jgi:hypothetical protein